MLKERLGEKKWQKDAIAIWVLGNLRQTLNIIWFPIFLLLVLFGKLYLVIFAPWRQKNMYHCMYIFGSIWGMLSQSEESIHTIDV